MNENKIEGDWLDCIKESSRRIYERNWQYFKDYMNMTAEEILADKKANNEKYKSLIFKYKTYLIEERQLSPNTARTSTGVVRGFFNFYSTPIHMNGKEKERLDKAQRTTTDYKFTCKDIAKMAMVASIEEKYVLLFGKSVGLRAGDFLNFTWGDFRKLDLDQEAPIYMGEYNTKKRGVKANCFIDCDSLPVIKALLAANTNKSNKNKVLTVRSSELSVILRRIADKAKIETGNDRIRFHCLRKWLITRISATMSESQWKQIVGKQISEGAYVSSDMLKKAYSRALKDITVMRGNGGLNSANVEKLKKENAALRQFFGALIGEDKIKQVLGQLHSPDEIELMSPFEQLAEYAQIMQSQNKPILPTATEQPREKEPRTE